ncbi:hypothetical protein B0H11DRAFT_2290249 [Mycena galericulata]|nr:hypothetical protein B0H11DRAFT_2290249 [Mycena galericulata]
MQRGETPPPGAHPSTPHSTPHSRGSGSDAKYKTSHNQSDYAPFLKDDLAHSTTLPLNEFLTKILQVDPNWEAAKRDEFSRIKESSKFKKLLAAYTQVPEKRGWVETDLYHPFVELANHCLEELGCEKNILCRNDDVYILGSSGQRKPDVVQVARNSVYTNPDRVSPDELSKEGPKESPFHWREILGFWEFKSHDLPADPAPGASAPRTAKSKGSTPASSEGRTGTRKNPPRPGSSAAKRARSPDHNPSPLGSQPEAKRSKKETYKDPYVQCASYALELLSHGGFRSHVVGVLVSLNSLELLYYDHSIVVKSEPLRFTEDTFTFLGVLRAFGRLDDAQWGYPKLLEPPASTSKPRFQKGVTLSTYQGCTLKLGHGWELELGEIIFQAHGLIGRGTTVVHAKVKSSPPGGVPNDVKDVVVKWNWSPKSRTAEADIVAVARKWAEQDDPSMLAHLPNILYSEEREIDAVPAALISFLDANAYEARVLRIIVQEKLEGCIDGLTVADELAEVYKDIFKCYRWLYQAPKIIHRDISRFNLMYRIHEGKKVGVLNDFDLALFWKDPTLSTSRQRTGTKPFMAIDLLVEKPPIHLYRHDLESFMYVLVFLTCQIKGSELEQWDYLDMKVLQNAKHSTVTLHGFPPFKAEFQSLRFWVGRVGKLFSDGFHARRDNVTLKGLMLPTPDFVDETLGGHVTFDTFDAILQTPIVA